MSPSWSRPESGTPWTVIDVIDGTRQRDWMESMPLVAYALSRSEATAYSRIQMDHGCGRLTIATGQSCDQEAILSSRLSVFKTPSSGTDGGWTTHDNAWRYCTGPATLLAWPFLLLLCPPNSPSLLKNQRQQHQSSSRRFATQLLPLPEVRGCHGMSGIWLRMALQQSHSKAFELATTPLNTNTATRLLSYPLWRLRHVNNCGPDPNQHVWPT